MIELGAKIGHRNFEILVLLLAGGQLLPELVDLLLHVGQLLFLLRFLRIDLAHGLFRVGQLLFQIGVLSDQHLHALLRVLRAFQLGNRGVALLGGAGGLLAFASSFAFSARQRGPTLRRRQPFSILRFPREAPSLGLFIATLGLNFLQGTLRFGQLIADLFFRALGLCPARPGAFELGVRFLQSPVQRFLFFLHRVEFCARFLQVGLKLIDFVL